MMFSDKYIKYTASISAIFAIIFGAIKIGSETSSNWVLFFTVFFTVFFLIFLLIGYVKPDEAPPKEPSIFKLPFKRNPFFTGRVEDLKRLRTSLCEEGAGAITQKSVSAVHGLGGIGKTGMAVEYAYEYRKHYDHIWWVKAENKEGIETGYSDFARKLKLPEAIEHEQRLVIEAVREWLNNHSEWLLIFDNAEEKEDLNGFLPNDNKGHIIITSREPDWAGVAATIGIEELEEKSAVELLLKRSEREGEEEDAKKLAETLGHMPLMLEQAGAYIAIQKITIAKYSELFKKERAALMAKGKPADYPYDVGATWKIAFDDIRANRPSALGLINVLAFLAPDDIPRFLFEDTVEFGEDIEALQHFSLITVTEENFSIHRLVQYVIQDSFGDEEKKKWAEKAVKLVNDNLPDPEFENWPDFDKLLAHAVAVATHSEELGIAPEEAGNLFNMAGLYLDDRGQYQEAKDHFERTLAILISAFGEERPNVAAVIDNLGAVLRKMGNFTESKDHHERAIKIKEKILQPDDPGIANSLGNLGNVLTELEEYKEAKDSFKRALVIYRKEYGEEHPYVAKTLSNLGNVSGYMGDLDQSVEYHAQALAMGKIIYPPHHPDLATSMMNLGLAYVRQEKYSEAKDHLVQALAIFRKSLGEEHPRTQRCIGNLERLQKEIAEKEKS